MRIITDLLSAVLAVFLLYKLNVTGDAFYGYLLLVLAFITGISLVLRRLS